MSVMPFGRHKGCDLQDLPENYLDWLKKQDLRPPLSDALRIELRRRKTGIEPEERLVSYPARYVKIPRADIALAKRLINLGHRVLVCKLAAEADGDPSLMARLNSLAEIVKEQLAEVRS